MLKIRHLIIDFIFAIILLSALESYASLTDLESSSGKITSNEMCMDEMFLFPGDVDQSVLRTTYDDNGTQVKYEVVVTEAGEAYVLRNNSTKVKSLNYTSGDYFSAILKPGVLEIYQNNTLVYSQPVSTSVSFQTSSAYIEDKLKPVVYDYIDGFCNGERKCLGDAWGDAGFVSKNVLKQSEEGEIKWTIRELDKYKVLGLGSYTTSKHYRDINYGISQATGGRFRVYESGRLKVSGPNVRLGDVVKIKKIGNRISYYLNDRIIYTSPVIVTKDLHILGSINSTNALIQNVEASFTEDYQVYTTATAFKHINEVKWNSLKHYEYSAMYKSMVSTDRTSSAISENYYQADLGHNPVSITPKLSNLFIPHHVNRDLSVIVGVKELELGNYLENEISYDRMLCGFVFERNRGNQRVYILNEGNVVGELPGFDVDKKYRISIDGTRLNLELEVGGRYQIFYSRTINAGKRHVVYQGTNDVNNPFVQVDITGFNAADFVKYAYHYDGDDNLLDVYNGDVKDVVAITKQKDILHRIGWYNLQNVKNYTSNVTVRDGIEQDNGSIAASGESVYRFNPTDEYKISFIYKGGDYSIGSKLLLSSSLTPFISGVNISGGNISLVNNGSKSNTTSISSGAKVSLLFNGNSTMSLQVNGSSVGSPITLPAAVLNLGMNLNQGAMPSGVSISAINTPPAPAASQIVQHSSVFVQETFNTTCNVSTMRFLLDPGMGMPAGTKLIEIIDVANGWPVHAFTINVNGGNVVYTHTLSASLSIGTYAYFLDGLFEGFFEVFAPAEWDDNSANIYVNNVDFDDAAYSSIASSILHPIGSSPVSLAKNTIDLPNTFSIRIPVTGTLTAFNIFNSNTGPMQQYVMQNNNGNVTVTNIETGDNFTTNQSGFLILDYINTGGGAYEEHASFAPFGSPFGRETKWVTNMNINSGETSIFLNPISDIIEGAGMTFCNSNITPFVTDQNLIFEGDVDCGSKEIGDENNRKDGYDPNTYSCPIFNLEFNIENLNPLTTYSIVTNMFYYDVNSSSFIEVYDDDNDPSNYNSVELGILWCNNLSVTTDSDGKSTSPITLNDITSEQLFNQDLYIKLEDNSGNEFYVHLNFSFDNDAINEVYRECFNYNVINYDCFFSEFGSIDNKRNYALSQPQTGNGEIDYTWINTTQPVNGGVEYDLETGCYTVSIDYEANCGLPQRTLQHKMLARADWEVSSSSGINYLTNLDFDDNQYKESKMILTGLGETRSFNKAPIQFASLIRYRHLYDEFQRDVGFYLEGTASNDFAALAHISEVDPMTGLSDVSLQLIENGIPQPLISTPIKLEKYQYLDIKIANNTITPNKLRVLFIVYPEFGQFPGDNDELTFWEKNDIDIPANGGENYQAYVKHYSTLDKTSNLGVNFCVEPVESYTALLQRSLHDGRHEVSRCINEPGNPNCPIPINGPCGLTSSLDILYFKFDEDYYRDIVNVESLDFEIRDYQNHVLLSSANNLANSIVKIGDNRYELSMTALNSIHPYYTLIVKNAKNEKRYLRFKK